MIVGHGLLELQHDVDRAGERPATRQSDHHPHDQELRDRQDDLGQGRRPQRPRQRVPGEDFCPFSGR